METILGGDFGAWLAGSGGMQIFFGFDVCLGGLIVMVVDCAVHVLIYVYI
jgi:hypothetical protein